MEPVRRWIVRAAIAACVLLPTAAVVAYVANPHGVASLDPRERVLGIGLYRIPSGAMAPTLQPGRIVLVRAGAAAVDGLQRGDIVTFVPPHQPRQRWIKRLVGLPGETIELRAGRLLVDGRLVPEPYLSAGNALMPYSREFGPQMIAPGHVLLLGDNRDNSEDGRFFGSVPRAALHGRLIR